MINVEESSLPHGFVLLVLLVVQKICGIRVVCGKKNINERLMPHYTEINV